MKNPMGCVICSNHCNRIVRDSTKSASVSSLRGGAVLVRKCRLAGLFALFSNVRRAGSRSVDLLKAAIYAGRRCSGLRNNSIDFSSNWSN